MSHDSNSHLLAPYQSFNTESLLRSGFRDVSPTSSDFIFPTIRSYKIAVLDSIFMVYMFFFSLLQLVPFSDIYVALFSPTITDEVRPSKFHKIRFICSDIFFSAVVRRDSS